jgi:hypothetical protein
MSEFSERSVSFGYFYRGWQVYSTTVPHPQHTTTVGILIIVPSRAADEIRLAGVDNNMEEGDVGFLPTTV